MTPRNCFNNNWGVTRIGGIREILRGVITVDIREKDGKSAGRRPAENVRIRVGRWIFKNLVRKNMRNVESLFAPVRIPAETVRINGNRWIFKNSVRKNRRIAELFFTPLEYPTTTARIQVNRRIKFDNVRIKKRKDEILFVSSESLATAVRIRKITDLNLGTVKWRNKIGSNSRNKDRCFHRSSYFFPKSGSLLTVMHFHAKCETPLPSPEPKNELFLRFHTLSNNVQI